MANERVTVGGIYISKNLFRFVNEEVIPGTNIRPFSFWAGAQKIITELAPDNQALLQKRDDLQAKIDEWHRTHKGKHNDIAAYKSFLFEIGYLTPRSGADNFQISTRNVDDEVAIRAGPQLVVPLMNARFTLNAANSRWGSLYDALYGTDAIPENDGCEKTNKYNKKRGDKVIAFTRKFLDQNVPLANGWSHTNAKKYSIETGELKVSKFIILFYFTRHWIENLTVLFQYIFVE
jgi:malate synthase